MINKKIKLVAIDLDGTLIGSSLLISKKNQLAIRKTMERGVKVCLATGRTFFTAQSFADKLKLNMPIICYQGAVIRSKNYIHFYRPLLRKYVKKVIAIAKKEKVQLGIYIDDIVYLDRPLTNLGRRYLKDVEMVQHINIIDLDNYRLAKPPLKMVFITYQAQGLKIWKKYERELRDELYVTISRGDLVEFLHRDVSKGKALEFLSREYKIKTTEMMAIGDNYNDLAMFEEVGLSVAVKNAPAPVERRADRVVKSFQHNGVAWALEKYVLGSEKFPPKADPPRAEKVKN